MALDDQPSQDAVCWRRKTNTWRMAHLDEEQLHVPSGNPFWMNTPRVGCHGKLLPQVAGPHRHLSLHAYIALHYTTLHYITLHYITLHCIHTNKYIQAYTYTYTHIHAHTYTCIHTHVYIRIITYTYIN